MHWKPVMVCYKNFKFITFCYDSDNFIIAIIILLCIATILILGANAQHVLFNTALNKLTSFGF